MFCKFYNCYLKLLASLHLNPKAIMALVLIYSLNYPAMGMDEDPTEKSGGIPLAHQIAISTTIEMFPDLQDQNAVPPTPLYSIQSPYFVEFPEDLHKKLFSFIGEFPDLVHCSQTCLYWHTFLSEIIQNKVFLIGPAGSGKSTLLYLLLGKPLVAQKGCLFTTEKIPNVDIVKGCVAGTLRPTCVLDFSNKRLIIDCPSFRDPRGSDQDFMNALALYRLLKGRVSVVLVMPEMHLCESDFGWQSILLFNKLTEIFPEQSQLKDILYLVVSKQGHLCRKEALSHIPTLDVKNFATGSAKCMIERGHDLLQFLIAHPNRLAGFEYPLEKGPYPYRMPENLKVAMQNWGYVVNPQVSRPLEKSVKERKTWSLEGYYNQDGTISEY